MISDVKNKIQGLIDSANETTGKEDATLTDAIMSLKDGFGGGVEYTTGRVTYPYAYGGKEIPHGLSKAPKLFLLYMDGYNTALNTNICGALYTEIIAGIIRNSNEETVTIVFVPPYTVPGLPLPVNNAIIVDNEKVTIDNPNRRWTAGDYTWEACTW